MNQPDVPGCTPPASLDVVTLQSDLFPIRSSLVGAQRGAVAAQTVHLRTRHGRKKPGKVVVKAVGKAPRGTRPAVDHDKYVLVRAPRTDACPATTTTTIAVPTTTTLPLDVYVMLDQSGSMRDQVAGGTSRLEAVASALTTFAQQPGVAGVGIGIQYFGLPPTLVCPTMCNIDAETSTPGRDAPSKRAPGQCRDAERRTWRLGIAPHAPVQREGPWDTRAHEADARCDGCRGSS